MGGLQKIRVYPKSVRIDEAVKPTTDERIIIIVIRD